MDGRTSKTRGKIAKEEQELGDLQRQQGAAENEIFRLAGDDTITKTLQKKKELETEIGQNMEDWLTALFIRSLMGKTQKRYDSGKQPKIIKMANRFLGRMTKGKYSLIVNDDGKDVSIIDEFYRKRNQRSGLPVRVTKYTWQSVWRWHFLLENRWKRFLSYWMIFLSVLMKNGRKKHFASSWSWEKNNRYFFLPVMNGR